MKTINHFLVLMLLVSLTACAGHKKQIQAPAKAAVLPAVEKTEAKAPETQAKPAAAPAKTALVTVYVVKSNDTLERIARKASVYGDGKMWPVIFEANRDKLSHPSKIYPGQKLRIPRDLNEISILKKRSRSNRVRETADEARREAQASKVKYAVQKPAPLVPKAPETVAAPTVTVPQPVVPVPVTEPAVQPSTPVSPAEELKVEEEGVSSQASKQEEKQEGVTVSGSVSGSIS
jgi:LysM repeat protein